MHQNLLHYRENTFKFEYTNCCEVSFKKNESDGKMQMIFKEKNEIFKASRTGVLSSENKDLSKYEGTYYSEEMEFYLKFKVKDGKLFGYIKQSFFREWWPYEFAGEEMFVLSGYYDASVKFRKTEK